MCEWFDETCGILLDELQRRGLADNTIVIYICDNGWAATSTNAADPNQTRFKDYALRSKSSPFENGIRTPVLVSWPAHIKPSRAPDLAHAVDVFPTIAAATGIEAPDGLAGINLLDESARKNRDTVYGVCHSVANMTPGDPDDSLQYRWCISGDWKLMVRHHGSDTTRYKQLHEWDKQPVRLYNLKDDPQEKNELSAAHPEIVENLRKRMDAWRPAPRD
jgi:arylsulfatase A-like enzyme